MLRRYYLNLIVQSILINKAVAPALRIGILQHLAVLLNPFPTFGNQLLGLGHERYAGPVHIADPPWRGFISQVW